MARSSGVIQNGEEFTTKAMGALMAGDGQSFTDMLSSVDKSTLAHLFERSKDLGNAMFQARDYPSAIEYYTAALVLAPSTPDKSRLFSNRSACYIKMQRYQDSLDEAGKCIALYPDWPKGWFRAGKALLSLGKLEAALCVLKKSLELMTGGSEKVEIENQVKQVTRLLAQEKQIARYRTDYKRFEMLARQIASEESEQAAPTNGLDSDQIQFREDLSQDKKDFLRRQLLGQSSGRRTSTSAALRSQLRGTNTYGLALGVRERLAAGAKPQAVAGIKSFLAMQNESQYPSRVLAAFESGILYEAAESVEKWIKEYHNDVGGQFLRVVCYGIGSLIPITALHSATEKFPFRNMEIHHVCLSTVPTQLEALLHWFDRNLPSATKNLIVHTLEEAQHQVDSPLEAADLPGPDPDKDEKPEEKKLAMTGHGIIIEKLVRLPREPDLLIVDLDNIDGYLLGPRNPLMNLKMFKPASMIPACISLVVCLATIDITDTWKTRRARSAYQWSVLPMPLPPGLANRITIQSEFVNAWHLNIFSERLEEDIQLSIQNLRCRDLSEVNAVIFSLRIPMHGVPTYDSWTAYKYMPASPTQQFYDLLPHFYWLQQEGSSSPTFNPSLGAIFTTTTHAIMKTLATAGGDASPPSDKLVGPGASVTLDIRGGCIQAVHVRQKTGSKLRLTSEALTIPGVCPWFNWSIPLHLVSLRDMYLEELQLLRSRAMSRLANRERRLRAHMIFDDQATSTREISLQMLVTNIKEPELAIHLVTSLLKRESDHQQVAAPTGGTDTRLLILVETAGVRNLAREMFRDDEVVDLVCQKCFGKRPGLIARSAIEWKRGNALHDPKHSTRDAEFIPTPGGKQRLNVQPKSSGPKEGETEVRTWLFAQTQSDRLSSDKRLEIVTGDLTMVRPPEEYIDTQETLEALSKLYGVPMSTPGLNDLKHTTVLRCPLEALVWCVPENFAKSDPLADNMLPSVLYSKQCLQSETSEVWPGRVTIKGFLAYLKGNVDLPNGSQLSVSMMHSLMKPGRLDSERSGNLPNKRVFHYGEKCDVDFDSLEARSLIGQMSEPFTLFDIDLNEDEHVMLRDFCPSATRSVRLLPNAALRNVNAVVTFAEYDLGPTNRVFSCAPESLYVQEDKVTLVPCRMQSLQFLPPVKRGDDDQSSAVEIQVNCESLSCYTITWSGIEDSEIDPSVDPPSLVASQVRQATAQLAQKIAVQTVENPDVSSEMAKGVIHLTLQGTDIDGKLGRPLWDSRCMNGLFLSSC